MSVKRHSARTVVGPRVVLFEPEIPPNTGNVARTCAGTGCELHLIEPLGFSLDDRHLRRAGLDYWPSVQLHRHASGPDFLTMRHSRGGRLVALSRHASCAYTAFAFQKDDWLLFGRESSGLPTDLLLECDASLQIPLQGRKEDGERAVRSLNLSVAVGIVLFEALRQIEQQSQQTPLSH